MTIDPKNIDLQLFNQVQRDALAEAVVEVINEKLIPTYVARLAMNRSSMSISLEDVEILMAAATIFVGIQGEASQ